MPLEPPYFTTPHVWHYYRMSQSPLRPVYQICTTYLNSGQWLRFSQVNQEGWACETISMQPPLADRTSQSLAEQLRLVIQPQTTLVGAISLGLLTMFWPCQRPERGELLLLLLALVRPDQPLAPQC